MLVENYIHQLLLKHDCVVLPNLGGFISHYRSAKIHPVSHRLISPSKIIRFNTQINKNDGLLAHYIGDCESISIQAANAIIDSYVLGIKNNLEHKKEAKISKIGLLTIDSKSFISFEANQQENYLLDSFGLEPIQSPPILRKKKSEALQNKIAKKANHLLKNIRSTNWKVAAVLLPLIAISSIISTQNDILKETYANYAFLNPFKIKPLATYTPRITNNLELITQRNKIAEHVEPKKKAKVQVNTVLPLTKEKKKETSIQNPSRIKVNITKTFTKFHLVAGCFSSKKNAINLSIKLSMEGFDSEIIGQNEQGLYRVVYATYTEKKFAISALERLKKSGKATWLLRQ
ncbi:MAG: hypothetical protein CMP57_04840 [Flavobacteriales bacterium]|nr:hypothetical protein [Flavobacteriales bacterium]|tara:strand:+ start:19966 stop:21003 length:1038 start_codon:yes stop_codon:yes gene_type:complete